MLVESFGATLAFFFLLVLLPFFSFKGSGTKVSTADEEPAGDVGIINDGVLDTTVEEEPGGVESLRIINVDGVLGTAVVILMDATEEGEFNQLHGDIEYACMMYYHAWNKKYPLFYQARVIQVPNLMT